MNVNTLLSTIILVTFIVTIVLAVGSYTAYKLRERRRPALDGTPDGDAPVFFERIYLGANTGAPGATSDVDAAEQASAR
jgi:hypothetical protein